jgi:hypothetical protein
MTPALFTKMLGAPTLCSNPLAPPGIVTLSCVELTAVVGRAHNGTLLEPLHEGGVELGAGGVQLLHQNACEPATKLAPVIVALIERLPPTDALGGFIEAITGEPINICIGAEIAWASFSTVTQAVAMADPILLAGRLAVT